MPAAWNFARTLAWLPAGVVSRQDRRALRTASFAAATSSGEGGLMGGGYAEGGGGTAGPLFGPAGSVFAEESSISRTPANCSARITSTTLSLPGVRRRSRKLYVAAPIGTPPTIESPGALQAAASGIPVKAILPKS